MELIKILSKHPKVKIIYLCAQKSIGKSIYSFDHSIKKKLPKISHISKINWKNVDALFTALPNGEAQKIATKIPNRIKLFDLSADFRLKKASDYLNYYQPHTLPVLKNSPNPIKSETLFLSVRVPHNYLQ